MQVKMNQSTTQTLQVPALGDEDPGPATLHVAADVPRRVVVRNIGPVDVYLAHTSTALQRVGQTNDAFLLPQDEEDVVVLSPKQGLYAAGAGVAGLVCILISDAIPLFLES